MVVVGLVVDVRAVVVAAAEAAVVGVVVLIVVVVVVGGFDLTKRTICKQLANCTRILI